MTASNSKSDLTELGQTLLSIGTLLMSSGANCQRITKTLERLAGAFNCTVDLLITHKALMVTINAHGVEYFHSGLKRTLPHGVNFKIVSGISRMSWSVVEENWSVAQINTEVERLISLPHYPRLLVLFVVSLAGASFCRLFDGSWQDMIVAFAATFAGLFIRQEFTKRNFNPYMRIFFAAFTSSMVASLSIKFGGNIQAPALLASVLYLIPGVPLINSFSDLINGNIMNGIVRSVDSLIIAFAISMGYMLAIRICQL
jgi:uncharacterized membrane protein YjjP (DUF1212 family)